MKLPSEEIQQLLKSIIDQVDKEDVGTREVQIRQWRRLKLLWEGFSQIWYSETAHDWRVYDNQMMEGQDNDQAAYDRPVNVFRAYLESIIAALSITIPAIKCFPDNADNSLDLSTARGGDKIAQLIYRHNDVGVIWLHALFVFVTEGMTACYSYPHSSEEFGTYESKEYEDTEEEHEISTCPLCGYELSNSSIPNTNVPGATPNPGQAQGLPGQENQQPTGLDSLSQPELRNQELDEYGPDSGDIDLHYELMQGNDLCPACMKAMDPVLSKEKYIVTRLVGVTTDPKTRVCMEVYGGLNVKVPNYARNQSECPYLIFEKEINYVDAKEKYKHLRTKDLVQNFEGNDNVGGYTEYGQWGRLSPQYRNAYPTNVVTRKCVWLRPSAYNFLPEDKAAIIRKKYPDGCKVVMINDDFAEACNQKLDDYWTILNNPMSDYIMFQPLGTSLTSIQDITNDLISLTLQTIEHGIGQTFVDPAVVNLKAYEQTEVLPGGIFPAVPKSGKGMSEAFHELRTATLSAEVLPFSANVQSLGQLASGAQPALFGGALQGSETASEYSMSRAQSLQRLQNTWKMFTTWWKTIFGKNIPMFVKEMQDDEHDVQKRSDGGFINVMIRRADLEGKLGKIELESNENLPITWAQRNDIIMKLTQNANPEIMAMLAAPENIPIIHEALGLVDLTVPGEDDVIKQYDEIRELLASKPITVPPDEQMMMAAQQAGVPPPEPQEASSVDVNPDIDNHKIEFEICRKWLVSEEGRFTKIDNFDGYRNVLLHAKEHLDILRAQMMPPPVGPDGKPTEPEGEGANPEKSTQLETQNTPIEGEVNVETNA